MSSRPTFAPEGKPIDIPAGRKAVFDALNLARVASAAGSLGFALGACIETLATGLGACLDEIERLRKDQ